jgi:hypothetical protein
MKPPYIKKFSKIFNFNVYIVDGEFIRTNIDEEFTNFGQHYYFKFIPENEFWIDEEKHKGEAQFYIDHMLAEYRLMKEGATYEKALEKANLKEERERKISKYLKMKLKKPLNRQQEIEKIRKKLIKKYCKKLKVWIVDGELVRDLFDVEFTEGGHDLIFPFIPKNEIWIDNDLSKREFKFVVLHEVHERNLMAKGWDYESAHKDSSKLEFACRNFKKDLHKILLKELK